MRAVAFLRSALMFDAAAFADPILGPPKRRQLSQTDEIWLLPLQRFPELSRD
jgi:hypothetical protein